jgi:hypothetical protein
MSLFPIIGAGDASLGVYNGAVTRSLRFNGKHNAENPVLARNFLTPEGTGKRWIFAFWIKPCIFGNDTAIITAGANATNYSAITFAANGDLNATDALHIVAVASNTNQYALQTKALFRDPTNWQHICIAFDSLQPTERNRMAIFINGKLFNDTNTASNHFEVFTDYPAEDTVPTYFNANGVTHRIGVFNTVGDAGNLEGYLADMYFLDNESIFSSTDATPTANTTFVNSDKDTLVTFCEQKNGIAIPKAYTGATNTYGNNGFHLDFKASGVATTAEATDANTNIGDDKSGNGHNFSVTDIDATDVSLDNPENNFCTLNSINKQSSSALDEGNLRAVLTSGGNSARTGSTFAVSSGKWYWEIRQNNSSRFATGVFDADTYAMPDDSTNEDGGNTDSEWVYITSDNSGNGARKHNNTITNSYGNETGNGEIVMVALDADNDAIWFGSEGTWFNNGTSDNSATVKSQIEAGTTTNAAYTSVTGTLTPCCVRQTGSNNLTFNFGQDSRFADTDNSAGSYSDGNGQGLFQHPVPSGFLALCSSNLPDVTFSAETSEQPSDYFNTFLYTGTNTVNKNYALNTFTPDWVWLKSRGSDNHVVIDSSRVTTAAHLNASAVYPNLHPNILDAEASDAHPKIIANGIQVSQGLYDNSGVDFVVWNWKANGGTLTTNDASATGVGDIDSVFQVSSDAKFSIVTYTGEGSNSTDIEIAHGLGVQPRVVIVKNRTDSNTRWQFYHEDLSADGTFTKKNLVFDDASAEAGYASQIKAVSSTTFTVRDTDAAGNATVNKSGSNYVAYCFAEVEGFSKLGSYTGRGSGLLPYIHTGFRPAWIIFKRATGGTGDWDIYDTKRDTHNVAFKELLGNVSNGESDSTTLSIDILSNGFKLRTTNANGNGSGNKYIYMAFAEQPFKFSNGR